MLSTSRFACAFAALVLVACPVWGDEAYRVILPKEERAVATALDRPARADYAGELRDVFGEIAKEHGVSIIVQETAIADAGLSADDPVDLRPSSLENPDLEQVLNTLLEPTGLGYVVKEGRLHIVPTEFAASKTFVRAYDVTGMLGPDATTEDVSKAVLQIASATQSGDSGLISFQIVPFRNRLIVIANRNGHAAVEDALEIMSQDATE
ncbi:MAG: hypothetical protein WBC44_05825 [Planctomycetaceae bacterium]